MQMGRFVDLICRKREGRALEKQEIQEMISCYVAGKIPDYQMAAMLMAIYFQGMTEEEVLALTLAMRDSGDIVDLSGVEGIKVDKHSTGGVGDKTTLIVAPMVAACGVPVAKMSGRGLGFTGGTLDKLESIPGFRIDLSEQEFFDAIHENGLSVIGQTANLAPADKLLYALRDVTGTVESIPSIAASIMSKKLAAGSDKIVLDVTTGSGAFIKDYDQTVKLAQCMVAIGNGAGKETVALITSMEEPLGEAVGNNLEVIEAIRTLQGEGPEDVVEVCIALAGMMISLGLSGEGEGPVSYEEGKNKARMVLENGQAWEKFRAMVHKQGGDLRYVDDVTLFPKAGIAQEVWAEEDGYIVGMNTEGIGIAAGILGAGREVKDSAIDETAGIRIRKKIGDKVNKGDVLAICYGNQRDKVERGVARLKKCIEIGQESPQGVPLIRDIIR